MPSASANYGTLLRTPGAAAFWGAARRRARRRRARPRRPAPHHAAPHRPAERRHTGRALLRSAFLRQVALGLTLGVFFGVMQVSITAYAVGRGTPDAAHRTRHTGRGGPALLRLQLHRPGGRLGLRSMAPWRLTPAPPGRSRHLPHRRVPSADLLRRTPRRRRHPRSDRTGCPGPPDPYLRPHRVVGPARRPHPGVHLEQLRKRGRNSGGRGGRGAGGGRGRCARRFRRGDGGRSGDDDSGARRSTVHSACGRARP